MLNVAPTVVGGTVPLVDEGELLSLGSPTFTDPGDLDTHTAQIDWDDGTVEAGTVTGSHTYADDGTYIATVTVTDDFGDSGSDTFTVTVGNVPPTVDAGTDKVVSAGDTVPLDPATFSDPGFDTASTTEDFTPPSTGATGLRRTQQGS